jgi:hypothetical protein
MCCDVVMGDVVLQNRFLVCGKVERELEEGEWQQSGKNLTTKPGPVTPGIYLK